MFPIVLPVLSNKSGVDLDQAKYIYWINFAPGFPKHPWTSKSTNNKKISWIFLVHRHYVAAPFQHYGTAWLEMGVTNQADDKYNPISIPSTKPVDQPKYHMYFAIASIFYVSSYLHGHGSLCHWRYSSFTSCGQFKFPISQCRGQIDEHASYVLLG